MDDERREDRADKKKILDDIRRSAQGIEAPESLSPEHILQQLEEQQKDGADIQRRIGESRKNRRASWKRSLVRLVEAAAVLILVAAAADRLEETGLLKAGDKSTAERMEMEEEVVNEEVSVQKSAAVNEAENAAADHTAADEADSEAEDENRLKPVGTSTDLFQKLWAYRNIQKISESLWRSESIKSSDMVMYEEELTAEEAEIDPTYDGADFSQTNLREAGVDEGDVVKTDGEYLYIMKKNSSVKIVRIDGGEMELLSTINPQEEDEFIRDMYLDQDKLVLVMTGTRSEMDEAQEDVYTVQTYSYTRIYTYDLLDRSQPQVSGYAELEGKYRSSRKSGDYVYLFTEFEPQLEATEAESRIMPLAADEEIPAEKIYVPEVMENDSYLVIASIDINHPSETVDAAAVVSGAERFYVSQDSIFICNEQWDNDQNTSIMKFHYEDGEITGVASGVVAGSLKDTFSLDEYQGYLRLVVTGWSDEDEINSLYVLDDQLKTVGKIEDIAPGETIRSARFMGDTGYFVTFRQTDPLFSVDLSDPENPQLLGELKVSGFSSYLHFYGENQLLGIGYEADEDTGITNGIKLSMFDISDPANVSESKRYVVKDASYCPGLSNYKAIMVDVKKNLFGFVCDGQYLVFSYDEEEGFVNKLVYQLEEEDGGYWYSHETERGLYVGDTFYLAGADGVLAFDMENGFELMGKLELD